MRTYNNNSEVWYGMTQNQLNSIYDFISESDINDKLFDYIAEKEMTFEDAEQIVTAVLCYPKGHTKRDMYSKGVFLFSA